MKGNILTFVALPLKHFENYFQEEVYPCLSQIALLDTFNHYCPGQYMIKFPNDIVCCEHVGKTSGALVRREEGYALFAPGVNSVAAPEGDQLRKHGIKSCCMKKHIVGELPTAEEFTELLYQNLRDVSKKYDTPEKVVEIMNKEYNKYDKTYKLSINNPNADLKKDGTFWTQKFPNALFKVDHKGMRYQYFSSYYDPIYFKVEGDPNKEKPYHLKYEYVNADNK